MTQVPPEASSTRERARGTRLDAQEPAHAGAVGLFLLGAPRIRRADGTFVEIERKLAAALLMAVWMSPASRERLSEVLWPQATPRQAQTNLRVVKHRLARAAGCSVLEPGPGVRLAAGVQVDVEAYRGLSADRLAPEALHALLDQPVLGHLEYPDSEEFAGLLRREREWFRELALDGLRALAERLAEDAGSHGRALELLARLSVERPTDELACRLSMRLLCARRDRAGALIAYERCREALSAQLGVSPSPATVALHRSVLVSDDDCGERMPMGEGSAAAIDSPPFVGREALLPRIWSASRQGRIVWITGEPGQGKTRLIREALRAHSQSVYVSCRPSDLAQPYASLDRLARELLGASSRGRPGVHGQGVRILSMLRHGGDRGRRCDSAQVLDAMSALLAKTGGQGVSTVVIDDLHFIDRASAEILHGWFERVQAARDIQRPAALPGLVLASRADEHSSELRELSRVLEGRDALERIELRPLSRDSIEALLNGLDLPWLRAPHSAATLLARSGGNPYIAIEVIRESRWSRSPEELQGVPLTVMEMLRARIERLDRAAQDLAILVAVAGTSYSAALADAVLGLPPMELARAWRTLQRAGIFNERGIAHDLALVAVKEHLPESGLEPLQSRIADFLVRVQAEPGEIARRLVAAGRRAEAVPHALSAAHHLCEALGLHEEAIELLDVVLGEVPPRGVNIFELCELRCQLTHWADEAVPDAVRLMRELATTADQHERAAVAHARCMTWETADPDSARESIGKLLASVPEDSPHRLSLLAAIVLPVHVLPDPLWARQLGAQLAEWVRREPAQVDALNMIELRRVSLGLLAGGEVGLHAQEMTRQAARVRGANRRVDLFHLQLMVQTSMHFAGDLVGWAHTTAELDGLQRAIGPRYRRSAVQVLGDTLMRIALGELEAARVVLEQHQGIELDANGQWTLRVGWLLLWQALGQPERFDHVLSEPLRVGPATLQMRWQAWEAAIVAAECSFRGTDARPWVEAGRAAMAGQRSHVAMTLDLLHAKELNTEPARAVVCRILEEATDAGRLGVAASAQVELAALECRAGRYGEARRQALQASRMLERHGNYVIWRGECVETLIMAFEVCDPVAAIGLRARHEEWLSAVEASLPAPWIGRFRSRWGR